MKVMQQTEYGPGLTPEQVDTRLLEMLAHALGYLKAVGDLRTLRFVDLGPARHAPELRSRMVEIEAVGRG